MRFKKVSRILLAVLLLFGIELCSQNNIFSEQPIVLKIAHFGPTDWPQYVYVLSVWSKKIEKLTEGRVKFEVFPNEALGKASEHYDIAAKGIADITSGITIYTPERFPLSSCMQLPFMGKSGEKASIVYWSLYENFLKDEFNDVKVLWLFCHGPGHLHTVNKPVKRLEDLKGLRIRASNPVLGKAIELLGATPVNCTINEGKILLEEGKVDGIILPWEGLYSFGMSDLCTYHTEINMYTLPFFAVMNKEKYESLPEDIKKLIDENIGEEMSALAGRVEDEEDDKAKKFAEAKGDFIYSLPISELERWRKKTMPVGDSWVKNMEDKGLPGLKVLEYVVELFIQIE